MPDYVYAIIGISFIFLCTTLGALFVFFFKKKEISTRLNQIFIGFASGVMLSASFFSLILPALEEDVSYIPSFVIVAISVILGALFLYGIDKLVPHLHVKTNEEEGMKSHLNKTWKMFLAVTIHNVPEGLSVGIAFGVALANFGNHQMVVGALLLALGIGLQNVPEGAVVSLPIKGESGSAKKAFWFGTLSGLVEPIAAVLGLFLAMQIQSIMPYALAFAAGCMIYVVAEEMIPELQSDKHGHFGVFAFIVGFVIMMVLDCIHF